MPGVRDPHPPVKRRVRGTGVTRVAALHYYRDSRPTMAAQPLNRNLSEIHLNKTDNHNRRERSRACLTGCARTLQTETVIDPR